MRKNEIAEVLKTIAENFEKFGVLVSSLDEEAVAEKKEKEQEQAAVPEAPQESAMTKAEFRKKLWDLASSDSVDKKNAIRDMALSYSSNEKLDTIPTDKYREILRKAEEILHA